MRNQRWTPYQWQLQNQANNNYVWLVARTVWFSFHLGCHRSAVSLLALNVSPLRQLPLCGDQTPASVPPPTKGRSSPTNTPVLPPGSFVLLSFVWFCTFFSTGQVLLSALPWCSACTSVKWRCIPDVSMERDVLHIHLLFCHLVLLVFIFLILIQISQFSFTKYLLIYLLFYLV